MLLLDLFAGYRAAIIHKKSKYNNLIDYLREEEEEVWDDYFDNER